MSRTKHKKHARVTLKNKAIKVGIEKVDAGTCPPVTEESLFDVLWCEWFLKEVVILEINLNSREIVRRANIPFKSGCRDHMSPL
jgi:hypothetical protein